MSSYADITTQLTDQWVAAVERAKESFAQPRPSCQSAAQRIPDARVRQEPARQLPELPSPREVVEANFQVAQRLLEAQRDFTLAVIERATRTAPTPAPSRSNDRLIDARGPSPRQRRRGRSIRHHDEHTAVRQTPSKRRVST